MSMTSILLLAMLGAPAAPGQHAALFDELTVLYPDTDPSSGNSRLAGDTPRGVPAGVHALITGLPPRATVSWTLTLDGARPAGARVYRLIDVPVEQNTGLVSRTEAWDGQPNPHVIRDAPFRVFEVLQPSPGALEASEAGVLAMRAEIAISPDATAGLRSCELALTAGDWRQTLHWELRVHPVTVPPTGPQSRGYTNWFSPDIIARRHGLEPWSPPFWDMLGRYANLMARGRQNTFWIRWRDFAQFKNGTFSFDRPRFERYVRLFLERGFIRIEGGHVAHRHAGDWSSPRLDLDLSGSDVTSEAGRAELAALLAEVRAALAAIDRPPHVAYLQHLTDEPTDKNAESYKALAEQVRRHVPGVRIFEATMSLELVGAVDAWCPQVHEYQKHRAFFGAREQAGDAVWVYTCLVPGGPWLNRLLDQERLRPVYLGWALVKYDLAGFLHWGFNHYRPGTDPLQQSVVPHGKGPPNFLPAGDSHVVYPGQDGPWSGQRFEAQRIGMEDGELLQLLQQRDPQEYEAVMNAVFRAFDDYEKDVSAYRAARRRLLTALAQSRPAE